MTKPRNEREQLLLDRVVCALSDIISEGQKRGMRFTYTERHGYGRELSVAENPHFRGSLIAGELATAFNRLSPLPVSRLVRLYGYAIYLAAVKSGLAQGKATPKPQEP